MKEKQSERVYDSIFGLLPSIDNPTPLVRVRKLAPNPHVHLYAKLEWYNPFGSVKDRAAWSMLQDLEARGELSAERGIVEPTSGNTGISLAAMAGARGYHVRCVIPNRVPAEKKTLLRIVGAELDVVRDDLCPAPGLGDGSINIAKTHAKASSHKYVMPNQYENNLNLEAHIRTTGPEIWRQTEGRVTHIFVALGTCGTVSGLGTFFREKKNNVKLYAVQPSEGHDIPGLRNVSQLGVSKLYDESLIEEVLEIDYEIAYQRAAELNRQEGLMASPCCGLIFEGACRILLDVPDAVAVMIFPDSVLKYATIMEKHLWPKIRETEQ